MKTGKILVKFKDGSKAEIYSNEKYRLVKKGLLNIPKKEQDEYDILFKKEKENKPTDKILGRTQNDYINKRIDALEEEILDIKIKQEKFKPETKELKNKPETK